MRVADERVSYAVFRVIKADLSWAEMHQLLLDLAIAEPEAVILVLDRYGTET